MVKSRQRKYPTVKSHLNIFREILIFIFSCSLWVYCIAVIAILLVLFSRINNYEFRLIRNALNLELYQVYDTSILLGYSSIGITVYLLISYFTNKQLRKRNYYEKNN